MFVVFTRQPAHDEYNDDYDNEDEDEDEDEDEGEGEDGALPGLHDDVARAHDRDHGHDHAKPRRRRHAERFTARRARYLADALKRQTQTALATQRPYEPLADAIRRVRRAEGVRTVVLPAEIEGATVKGGTGVCRCMHIHQPNTRIPVSMPPAPPWSLCPQSSSPSTPTCW